MSEYFKALQEQKLARCPHIIRKLAGDETYDTCELNTKSCLIEHGLYNCETWEEIQKEWLEELGCGEIGDIDNLIIAEEVI